VRADAAAGAHQQTATARVGRSHQIALHEPARGIVARRGAGGDVMSGCGLRGEAESKRGDRGK
jgi:hypothetical protein